jgi:hypothetical protein
MIQRKHLRRRSRDLSFGQDPDLIARHLAAEQKSKQLSAMASEEQTVSAGQTTSKSHEERLKPDDVGIDEHESARFQQPAPAREELP